VKAEIRKHIGKNEGDWVEVVLYHEDSPVEITRRTDALPGKRAGALDAFMEYTEGEKKAVIGHIYSARTEETKVRRIAETLSRLKGARRN